MMGIQLLKESDTNIVNIYVQYALLRAHGKPILDLVTLVKVDFSLHRRHAPLPPKSPVLDAQGHQRSTHPPCWPVEAILYLGLLRSRVVSIEFPLQVPAIRLKLPCQVALSPCRLLH